jgi:hypothetical protein
MNLFSIVLHSGKSSGAIKKNSCLVLMNMIDRYWHTPTSHPMQNGHVMSILTTLVQFESCITTGGGFSVWVWHFYIWSLQCHYCYCSDKSIVLTFMWKKSNCKFSERESERERDVQAASCKMFIWILTTSEVVLSTHIWLIKKNWFAY